jgi:hypothetical protein
MGTKNTKLTYIYDIQENAIEHLAAHVNQWKQICYMEDGDIIAVVNLDNDVIVREDICTAELINEKLVVTLNK